MNYAWSLLRRNGAAAVLVALLEHGPANPARLAVAADALPVTVRDRVRELSNAGLVRVHRAAATGQMRSIELTPPGRAAAQALVAFQGAVHAELVRVVPKEAVQ